MEMPVFRTGFNYDREAASNESGLFCSDPSLAQQQFRDESDINTIVKRFNLTGELPTGVRVPQYGDFSAVVDYHSALNLVIAADEAFMKMPASVRAKFDNDAGRFVDFVSNPGNKAEIEKLGVEIDIGKSELGAVPQEPSQQASPPKEGAAG